jgi:hypothetical protein
MRICSDAWKLLVINLYLPYEGESCRTDEFIQCLSVLEDLIDNNSDCHIVAGGDFNVDFSRRWLHTDLLVSFCEKLSLSPIQNHNLYAIDYTYQFGMSRFSILDHFILSGTLFDNCIDNITVLHDIANLSDHDPVIMSLLLDTTYLSLAHQVLTPRVSWDKATDDNLMYYRTNLSQMLHSVDIPVEAILCRDLKCTLSGHHDAIRDYSTAISQACMDAGKLSLPETLARPCSRQIPGWSERVAPLKDKSLFWHRIWCDCGRPRCGTVADCMRRTRAAYHYAIRQLRRDENAIIRERMAEAMIKDPGRNFWAEVKKIRNCKQGNSRIVDNCMDENSIASLFASNYRSLYTSVPSDVNVMHSIYEDIEANLNCDAVTDFVITSGNVRSAISQMKARKTDGEFCLSSDYFLHADNDLSVHLAFVFTSMIVHGTAPESFLSSTILPIPKNKNINAADSSNYRGIALSSVYGKIFDNIVINKYSEKLHTSELQFGFKQNSSTHMCTMVLKEAMAYYHHSNSTVFCTFLDASKAFDRVNYGKLFRLLIERGLPSCIVRMLVNLYTQHRIRVSWGTLFSSYFTALNGVKQGGVMSPVLFCVYIDNLLAMLQKAGVGCFIGSHFVGALAYADDIVLIAPTVSAMRTMLALCDGYATEFDIQFNAQKSKCLIVAAANRRFIHSSCNISKFNVGGHDVDFVESYIHLGHVITSKLDDTDDIMHRRNLFIGQVNSVLCFFADLDSLVKVKLFKAYCCSLYGSVLWSLDNRALTDIGVAWRRGLRRVLGLPFDAHSFLLPLLSETLPLPDELCKRFLGFSSSCFLGRSLLVRSIAWHGVYVARYNSPFGKNFLLCCKRYGWSPGVVLPGKLSFGVQAFQYFVKPVTRMELCSALAVFELIMLRDGIFQLSNGMSLSRREVDDLVVLLACT